MNADGIVPDVIDEVPSSKLTVIFPGGREVNFGNELTPAQVKYQPDVKWNSNPAKYYTLSMVDPDVPSRQTPQGRECNHWLVVNIKGNDVASGDVIAEYIGSGPPKDSGFHRYTFLVYQQEGKLNVDEPRSSITSVKNRLKFSIRNFAKKYNLGKPIAGNYYNAQWEPYVDEYVKQFVDF